MEGVVEGAANHISIMTVEWWLDITTSRYTLPRYGMRRAIKRRCV